MSTAPGVRFCSVLLLHLTLVTAASAIHSCSSQTSYEGYSAYAVVPTSASQTRFLNELLANPCNAFLLHPDQLRTHTRNVVVVAPPAVTRWARALPPASYSVITTDLATLLHSPSAQTTYYPGRHASDARRNGTVAPLGVQPRATSGSASIDEKFYESYYTLDVLEEKWANLSAKFSPNVTLEVIGYSHENRSIYALHVGRTNASNPRRLLVNSLLHAREWVTVPATTYAAERLAVSMADSRAPYAALLSDVQLTFVPVANPDGYVITTTTDRLWRKNARAGATCDGVDLNRNWDLDFAGPHSTSTYQCSDIYTGSAAFSEPETRALRDLVERTPGVVVHLDVHSFSQIVIGPWSHTAERPPNLTVVEDVGNAIADGMSRPFGTPYRLSLQSKFPLIYQASGTMTDWMFARNVLSFGLELRPGQYDIDSFLLPENQILPTCKEVFASLRTLIYFARDRSPPSDSTPTSTPSPTLSVSPEVTDSGKDSSSSLSTAIIVAIGASAAVFLIIVFALTVIFLRSCCAQSTSDA